ncbi:hypothetical protein B0H16DRAFT_1456959 [Mycena metata]|uniref:Uncharacterized protein n=1 Tax=Mycena metata TaxID=1033252 RepID=A0AAD7J7T5_9AGAR|nr:hypothetical protein B0H16DRAFT_1456959 [Mycena metata]
MKFQVFQLIFAEKIALTSKRFFTNCFTKKLEMLKQCPSPEVPEGEEKVWKVEASTGFYRGAGVVETSLVVSVSSAWGVFEGPGAKVYFQACFIHWENSWKLVFVIRTVPCISTYLPTYRASFVAVRSRSNLGALVGLTALVIAGNCLNTVTLRGQCLQIAPSHSISLEMPALPDVSLPNLTVPLSPATSTKVMIGLILIGASLHYASPTRLTHVLSDAMSSLEKVYTDLVCMQLMGLLTADDVARLNLLQLEVGVLRAQTLLHSLSWRATIREFLRGRSFTLYRCINEVRDLETHFRV